jgi:hypothetical protein
MATWNYERFAAKNVMNLRTSFPGNRNRRVAEGTFLFQLSKTICFCLNNPKWRSMEVGMHRLHLIIF